MRKICLSLLLLAPIPAFADCRSTTVLSCPIGKKQLEVCLDHGTASYSFGPKSRPELALSQPLRDIGYQPWSGVGRAMWDAVTFRNDDTEYTVWTSFDRLEPGAVWEGGVTVERGGQTLAELRCAKGSVAGDLYAVMEAKQAAGQCWDRDSFAWLNTPCP